LALAVCFAQDAANPKEEQHHLTDPADSDELSAVSAKRDFSRKLTPDIIDLYLIYGFYPENSHCYLAARNRTGIIGPLSGGHISEDETALAPRLAWHKSSILPDELIWLLYRRVQQKFALGPLRDIAANISNR
jgi:hypothetical protein